VTINNGILIQKRFIALKIANSEYEKARHDQKAEKIVIPMNSEVCLYFNALAEEVLVKINKAALIANLQLEKQTICNWLADITKTLHPAGLTYRPVMIDPPKRVQKPFITVDQPVTTKKKVKKKSTTVKKSSLPTIDQGKSAGHTQVTSQKEVAALYQDDVMAVKSHYFKILNNESHLVRNDQRLRVKAIIGLAETLPMINDDNLRQEVIAELERHAQPMIIMYDTAALADTFLGQYDDYVRLIKQYKRVVEPEVINTSATTQVQSAQPGLAERKMPVKMSSYKPRLFSAEARLDSSPVKAVTSTRFTQDITRKIPEALAEFADMWKDIPLDNIELSPNELNILTLLYQCHLTPLLQGGVIVDTIRGVPYRNIDLICFSTATELAALFNEHKTA
jgi:hypothetical protein